MKGKNRCECGQQATVLRGQGKAVCPRCAALESGDFAGYKMTETYAERRARKKTAGLPDGDKFPLGKIPNNL